MSEEKRPDHNKHTSWKFELYVVLAAAAVLTIFLAIVMNQREAEAPRSVSHFIQSDFDAFDRGFSMGRTTCDVGIAAQNICLHKSPLEKEVRRGEVLPDYIPALSAEFRVIVETSLKDAHLRTVRYGQTLVLIEPETRRVEDVLNLAAPDFVAAPIDPQQPKV